MNAAVLHGAEAVDILTLPFCSRGLTPFGDGQAHFKLPVPGWVAAASHTGGSEDLHAIP